MVKIKLCRTVRRYPLQQGLNLNIAKLYMVVKKSTIKEIFTPRYYVSFGDWPMEVQQECVVQQKYLSYLKTFPRWQQKKVALY